MYYSNISNNEVKLFHNSVKSNFNALLIDIIDNSLFNVETIIENKLYRIVPLFHCDTIVSTNKNDKILDNRCIICEYSTKTVLYFNTTNSVNNFDYNYKIRTVNGKYFIDFIFFDNITLNRLNNIEITVEWFDNNDNILLSEDYCTNTSGNFIFKQKNVSGATRNCFTFKYNDIVKTFELSGD